jgi:hypothetical protein
MKFHEERDMVFRLFHGELRKKNDGSINRESATKGTWQSFLCLLFGLAIVLG